MNYPNHLQRRKQVKPKGAAVSRNLLVNYPNTFNSANKARQIAVSDDSQLLFHPSGSVIQVFHVQAGGLHKLLRGAHFDTINCCIWNSELQVRRPAQGCIASSGHVPGQQHPLCCRVKWYDAECTMEVCIFVATSLPASFAPVSQTLP